MIEHGLYVYMPVWMSSGSQDPTHCVSLHVSPMEALKYSCSGVEWMQSRQLGHPSGGFQSFV